MMAMDPAQVSQLIVESNLVPEPDSVVAMSVNSMDDDLLDAVVR